MPVGSNTQAQNKLTETVKNAYENIVQTVSLNEEKNEQDVRVYFKTTTVSQDINCNNEQGGKFLCDRQRNTARFHRYIELLY